MTMTAKDEAIVREARTGGWKFYRHLPALRQAVVHLSEELDARAPLAGALAERGADLAIAKERLANEQVLTLRLRSEREQTNEAMKKLLAWIKTTHRLSIPPEGIRAILAEGRKIVTLLWLLLPLALFAQPPAPYERNSWSTNVAGTPVRGLNNLSVTNLGGTNWLFHSILPNTVARLSDITNTINTNVFLTTNKVGTIAFSNATDYIQAGMSNSFQPASPVLSNLVGTVARNVTNVVSLSTSNATSKPITNSYTAGVLTVFGLEASGAASLSVNASNIVVNADTNGLATVAYVDTKQQGSAVLTNLVGTNGRNVTNADPVYFEIVTGTLNLTNANLTNWAKLTTNAFPRINPTISYVPYNLDGTNFGDSPLVRRASNVLSFEGIEFNLTNSFGSGVLLQLKDTNTIGFLTLGLNAFGNGSLVGNKALTMSAPNSSLTLQTFDKNWLFTDKTLTFSESNTFVIGSLGTPLKEIYVGTNSLYLGTNTYTDNGANLLRNGVAIGSGGGETNTMSSLALSNTLVKPVFLDKLGVDFRMFGLEASGAASVSMTSTSIVVNADTNGLATIAYATSLPAFTNNGTDIKTVVDFTSNLKLSPTASGSGEAGIIITNKRPRIRLAETNGPTSWDWRINSQSAMQFYRPIDGFGQYWNSNGLVEVWGPVGGPSSDLWSFKWQESLGVTLNKFTITSNGNPRIINGLGGYVWPAAHVVGALTNNGSGSLGWHNYPVTSSTLTVWSNGVPVASAVTNLNLIGNTLVTNVDGNVSFGFPSGGGSETNWTQSGNALFPTHFTNSNAKIAIGTNTISSSSMMRIENGGAFPFFMATANDIELARLNSNGVWTAAGFNLSGHDIYGATNTSDISLSTNLNVLTFGLSTTTSNRVWQAITNLSFTNQVWVDLFGDDATAQMNNPAKPYRTISLAASNMVNFPGTIINVGSGTFIERHIRVPTNGAIRGMGMNKQTQIIGSVSSTSTIVPSDNCLISDLYVEGGAPGAFADPIGASRTRDPSYTNARIQRVWMSGSEDAFHVVHSNVCTTVIDLCLLESTWDTVVTADQLGVAQHYTLVTRSVLNSYGPSYDFLHATSISPYTGRIELRDCDLTTTNNAGLPSYTVFMTNDVALANQSAILDNCRIFTRGTAASKDVYNPSNNFVLVTHMPTNQMTITGTLTYSNILSGPLIAGTGISVTRDSSDFQTVSVSPITGSGAVVLSNAPSINNAKFVNATASRVAVFDGSSVLISSVDVDSTELSYLDAATSNIQDQLNGKQTGSGVLTNLVGTVANNVTNYISLSTSNATSKPLTNSYTAGVLTQFGLEQGANVTLTMNPSNIVIASTGGGGSPPLNTITNGVVMGVTTNLEFTAGTAITIGGNVVANTNKITITATRVGVYRTIYFDAGAMVPNATFGAQFATDEYGSPTNRMIDSYIFANAVTNVTQVKFAMPLEWDLGTVKVKLFYWSTNASATATNVWAIDATAISHDEQLDADWGTAQTLTHKITTANDLQLTAATAALTVGGTPAANDMVWFRVRRLGAHADDNDTGQVKLLGAWLQYKESTTEPAIW